MAHLSSIGAGMFSDMSVSAGSADLTPTQVATMQTAAVFDALFATEIQPIGGVRAAGTFMRIPNVRDFPSMGVPANISSVPRYGAKMAGQVQGQAQAPTLELNVNYIGANWAKVTSLLGDMIGDGKVRAFRFAMLNVRPTGYASTAGGLGTVENTHFYFLGKMEAIMYSPQLTDANQATVTLSQISDEFYGGFTL